MLKRTLLLLSLCLAFALTSMTVLAQDAEATEAVAATTESAPVAASSGMITGLWHLHSGVRWLVVVITVVLLVKLLMGVIGGGSFDRLTATLTKLFTISISIQWLIGVVLMLVWGVFDLRYRWEHALIMTVAVGVASMSARWKKAPDAQRYRMTLLMVIITLILVYIGVAVLPQGWRAMPVTG